MAPTKASESWHESVDYGPAYFLFVPASVFSVYQVSFVKDRNNRVSFKKETNKSRKRKPASEREREEALCV